MKYSDSINKDIILRVINEMPDTFYTKDISSHQFMINGHPELFKHSHYNAFIGKYLKNNLKDSSGRNLLTELRAKTSRGSLWQKAGSHQNETKNSELTGSKIVLYKSETERQIKQSIETCDINPLEIGPQCKSDSLFKSRMRYKQSHYRANVLKIPFGIGPNENSKTYYGNMLIKEDGDAGKNFLNDIIIQVVKDRVFKRYGALDPFRLLRNMLSSQPMCFNLFGMMKKDTALASDFWKIHYPEIKEITRVEFEYAPQPAVNYLNDRTAFDAYFEYVSNDSKKGFIGIEVKFTEPFSQKYYDTEYYRRWSDSADSPWLPESKQYLSNMNHNQLWRDHLLVISMINQTERKFDEGKHVLVRHQEDSDCERTVEKYKTHLKPDDKTFREFPLDKFLSAFDKIKTEQGVQKWLSDFKLRYLTAHE